MCGAQWTHVSVHGDVSAHHRSHCRDKRNYSELSYTPLGFQDYVMLTLTYVFFGGEGAHAEVTVDMTHSASQQVLQSCRDRILFEGRLSDGLCVCLVCVLRGCSDHLLPARTCCSHTDTICPRGTGRQGGVKGNCLGQTGRETKGHTYCQSGLQTCWMGWVCYAAGGWWAGWQRAACWLFRELGSWSQRRAEMAWRSWGRRDGVTGHYYHHLSTTLSSIKQPGRSWP